MKTLFQLYILFGYRTLARRQVFWSNYIWCYKIPVFQWHALAFSFLLQCTAQLWEERHLLVRHMVGNNLPCSLNVLCLKKGRFQMLGKILTLQVLDFRQQLLLFWICRRFLMLFLLVECSLLSVSLLASMLAEEAGDRARLVYALWGNWLYLSKGIMLKNPLAWWVSAAGTLLHTELPIGSIKNGTWWSYRNSF